MKQIFDTDRKIRLGIWGLGRGSTFLKAAKALNIEIVAGCDFNENLRNKFKEDCPDAFITDNEDDFLNTPNMDAVLIGPGLGQSDETLTLLQTVLEHFCGPVVVDADGINLLANAVEKRKHIRT